VRALVIDDSRAVRAVLVRMLRGHGFTVTEAGNGVEALERLKHSERFDLALVDWNMPEMDGLTFIQTVRADPAHAQLRLMMVTTENDMERLVAALEAGADEYIMKPFSEEALLDKLALLGLAEKDGQSCTL
jgi:two-component system, chemotaxis family, chemotaxis protein CheY